MIRKAGFGLGLVILLLLWSSWSVHVTTGSPQPQRSKAVDRTTPILKRMTPAQLLHARLHASHVRGERSKPLDEKLIVERHSDPGPTTTPAPTVADLITHLACRSDAVFTGLVQGVEVLPTADGTWMFSDYDVLTTEIYRSPHSSELTPGEKVIVTRPGGLRAVDGHKVGVKMSLYPELEIGHDYLFFVEFLPRYRTFHTRLADGVFAVAAGTARPLIRTEARGVDLLKDGLHVQNLANLVRGASCDLAPGFRQHAELP